MLTMTQVHRGQIVCVEDPRPFALPPGVEPEQLLRVVEVERNGIICETKEGARVELQALAILPAEATALADFPKPASATVEREVEALPESVTSTAGKTCHVAESGEAPPHSLAATAAEQEPATP